MLISETASSPVLRLSITEPQAKLKLLVNFLEVNRVLIWVLIPTHVCLGEASILKNRAVAFFLAAYVTVLP